MDYIVSFIDAFVFLGVALCFCAGVHGIVHLASSLIESIIWLAEKKMISYGFLS